jgi:hypothetical protein
MEVVYPQRPVVSGGKKVVLTFTNDEDTAMDIPPKLAVPLFTIDETKYVLVHHLSQLWNYPSSYHLIRKIISSTSLKKDDFLHSDERLNHQLVEAKLIHQNRAFFYIELNKIYGIIENKEVFLDNEVPSVSEVTSAPATEPSVNYDSDNERSSSEYEDEDEKIRIPRKDKQEKVTVGQVFPQYGYDDSAMNHGNFNCLTSLSKLNFYKAKNLWKFLPNNKISFEDRELVLNAQQEMYDVDSNEKAPRKQVGKTKKSNTHIDPNTIDLTESVIPGQGYVHEFNVNHLCKVPNYYVMSSTQTVTPSKIASTTNITSLNENTKVSRNIQLLINNNDPEAYALSKYFYTRAYRGPGSGNYKDAALMNRINRIPLTDEIVVKHHKITKEVKRLAKDRYNQNLKGFVHEKFNKYMVDHLLKRQREHSEDYHNMEMLHNNLLFNLLVNSYREISKGTWNNYYKFKMIDHEQRGAVHVQKLEAEKKAKNIEEFKEWKQGEMQRAENDRKNLERVQLSGYDRQSFKPTKPLPGPKPVETPNLDIINRFTLPNAHKEIVRNLPVDLRNAPDSTTLKGPISCITNYPDVNNPQVLNRIEIIKLPNLNEIGWENLRKFRSNYD